MKKGKYEYVVIESYRHTGGGTKEPIGARLLAGQGHSGTMRVECSSEMRSSQPVGTKFLIRAKITSREGGVPFLYTHYSWPYKVMTDKEAAAHISAKHGK